VMEAVYSDFLDPRDPLFARPGYTATVRTVRPCPQEVPHPEEVVAARFAAYTQLHAAAPTAEQLQAWRIAAEGDTPKAVRFYHLTFSPDKSVTVLYVAAVRAANDALESRGSLAARV
jgi:hypothetical protein